MIPPLRRAAVALLFAGCAAGVGATPGVAQQQPVPAEPPTGTVRSGLPQQPPPAENRFQPNELLDAGHRFFGGVSRGLAMIVEKAVSQWGLPNGYVLGEEAGGAFIGGRVFSEG